MTTVPKELLEIGGMLSNVAFNLVQSQPAGVGREVILKLDDLRKKWDAAARPAKQAAIDQPEPEPIRVYLVATGEIHEGQETYTRHDVRPPLCDAEVLYTHPAPAKPTEWQYVVQLLVAAGHVSQAKVDEACGIAESFPNAPVLAGKLLK